MRLNVLERYLRNLAETIALSDGESRAPGDLRQASDLLASLGEIEVEQLAELLRQAQEYRNTKELAIPGFLRPTVTAYDTVRVLRTRASTEVNREDLVRDLQAVPLHELKKEDLVNLVREFGWPISEKAKANEAIDAVWQGITGGPKPKKRAASTRTPKAAPPFPVEEFAQKVTALKERAHAPDSTPEELEQSLKQLDLEKLTQKNLVDLARQLSCDVNPKTKKADAIKAIERVVLVVKELMVSTLS
jgi:hypothetical protein